MIDIEKIKEVFYAHPLKLLFGMVNFCGGIFFLFYFIHIAFMPTLHIQDMVHLILMMALMGILIFFALVGMFVAPAFIWKSFEENISNVITLKEKDKEDDAKKKQEKMMQYLFAFHLVIAIALIIVLLIFNNDIENLMYISLAIVVIPFYIFLRYLLKKNFKIKWVSILLIGLAIYFIIIFPVFVLAIMMGHLDSTTNQNEWMGWIITIFGLFLVFVVNFLLVYDKSMGKLKYFIPFVAIFVFEFAIIRDMGFISRDVMRMLHIGNFKASEIVLKSYLCNPLHKRYPDKISFENNTTCIIKEVKVYSNIGQEMLIGIHENNISNKVVLLKKNIIGYEWEE